MKRILLIILALGLVASRQAGAADVTATLDPDQVEVGETAQLTVTVTGSSSADPSIPNIPGLEIVQIGKSKEIRIDNGSISSSIVHTYAITPQRAGNFIIPPMAAGGARSEPLALRVTGNGSAAPPGGSSQNSAANGNLPAPDEQATGNSKVGFIQVAIPKTKFYVGELVPINISIYSPQTDRRLLPRLEGQPTLTSDAFALDPLPNNVEWAGTVVDGRQYAVCTLHTALTAVKPGVCSLSVQMPLVVWVRQQQHRRNTGNAFFDQFFDDGLSQLAQKEVKLSNEPVPLNVQELPAANRPADFAGAIGQFEVHASASPTKVTVGDPITLRLEVSGTGDFDRATSKMVDGTDGWKTYPPKSKFQASDSASYQGTKTFEQLIIPEDADLKEIPALHFSYFDPKKGQYETRTTSPIPLTVSDAPAALTASNAAPAAAAPGLPAQAPPDLVPNKIEPGRFVATLQPVFTNPWFMATQGVPLCALAGGLLFLRRRRRLAADPRQARANAAERAIATQLAGMDEAIRQNASSDFFLCARSALQQRLGERWNVRPETITLAEINHRMNGAGDGIRPIFEMADQASYSGQNLGEADFRQWKDLVIAQLKALEKEP